jgi:hypothetical protein
VRRLDADVLSGEVVQWLLGLEGQHRDVRPAQFEETPSLQVHRGREHGPDFGVPGKQLGVEVSHCRISNRLEQPD